MIFERYLNVNSQVFFLGLPEHLSEPELDIDATKPETLSITEFKRPQDLIIDEQTCLLAQGLVCMGPATRSGCEAACIQGNMPCTGCCGPTSRVRDQGAKILSCLASLVESKEDAEIDRVLNTMPDPVGTFYRYGLPGSFLRRKKLNGVQASK